MTGVMESRGEATATIKIELLVWLIGKKKNEIMSEFFIISFLILVIDNYYITWLLGVI